MPSRNVIKINVPNSSYHAYIRGVNKQRIFLDESDYRFFFTLLDRFLSKEDPPEQQKTAYRKLDDSVEVLAYCLMPNHFHLLIYQNKEDGVVELMRGVMTGYNRYFNKKYKRRGPLFESRYDTSRITSDEHLLHISRYIHLHPDEWADYPYSSIRAYLYNDVPCWMNKVRIAELYGSAINYFKFLQEYKKDDDEIKI